MPGLHGLATVLPTRESRGCGGAWAAQGEHIVIPFRLWLRALGDAYVALLDLCLRPKHTLGFMPPPPVPRILKDMDEE